MSDAKTNETVNPSEGEGSQLSESQETVLNQGLVPAGETESFEAIQKLWEDGELDEQVLHDYVVSNVITAKQFEELTGEDYVEGNQSSNETVAYLYTATQVIGKWEEAFANANLVPSAALAMLPAMVSRHELSVEDSHTVQDWLKTKDSNIGGNQPNEAVTLKSQMLTYKPAFESVTEAKKEASALVAEGIGKQIEFEGRKSQRLTVAIAAFCHFSIQDGSLTIGYEKNKETGVRTTTIHKQLKALIKEKEFFGKVKEDKEVRGKDPESNADKVANFGTTYDPYNDKGFAPVFDACCMRAVLIAYPHSPVRFGFMKKTSIRPSRKTRLLSELPEGENPSNYFEYAGIPYNLLKPFDYEYKSYQKTFDSEKDGKPTQVKRWVTELVKGKPEEDTSLVWLPNDAVEPLIQHYFAGHTLSYEDNKSGRLDLPLGTINGSYDPKVGPVTRKRPTKTTTADPEQTKVIERLEKALSATRVERDRAMQGLDMERIVSTSQAIAAKNRNYALPVNETEFCNEIDIAISLVDRFEHGIHPGQDGCRKMVELYKRLMAFIQEKEEGEAIVWNVVDRVGNLVKPIPDTMVSRNGHAKAA